jgi:hypothetical protein
VEVNRATSKKKASAGQFAMLFFACGCEKRKKSYRLRGIFPHLIAVYVYVYGNYSRILARSSCYGTYFCNSPIPFLCNSGEKAFISQIQISTQQT